MTREEFESLRPGDFVFSSEGLQHGGGRVYCLDRSSEKNGKLFWFAHCDSTEDCELNTPRLLYKVRSWYAWEERERDRERVIEWARLGSKRPRKGKKKR